MQLGAAFSALLASLALLSTPAVDAAPVRRNAGTITLPLTRIHHVRSDLPADVQLQQHINRAHKRYARMTGNAEPSAEVLAERINKRLYIPAHKLPTGTTTNISKRYNRKGTSQGKGSKLTPLNNDAVTATGKKGKGAKVAATGGAGAAAGTNVAADASTAGGFSKVALAAQQKGGLTAGNTPNNKDSLALDDEANDVGYIATIQMGTPPRDFKLLMDSGSADLWVGASAGCTDSDTGADCGNHTFLGADDSSTFVDTGKPFAVTYGSGAVKGNIVTDNIAVAGLALNKHTFGVATTESDQFASNGTPFDGLMGLAQSTLSEQGVPTPPESLASAGLINEAIVLKLSRLQDGLNNGEVTFGSVDPATIDAATSVTLNNVATNGFWQAKMDTVTVGGKDLALAGRTAILDTGTTLIIAPPADATAVHQQITGAKSDGQGGFTIPCTTSTQVALSFGGQSFAIDPRDMIFSPVDPNDLTGDCVSGISSGEIDGATTWLVGDVFLKNAVFTTDVGKNNIQLAKPAA